MTWSWAEIEHDWLAGSAIADTPEVVVDAFQRVESAFGREWIEDGRTQESAAGSILSRGSSPTLSVVVLGKQLAVLENSKGCEPLVRKLRARDASAFAELAAAWLVGAGERIFLECEPEVTISRRSRKPDFRLRLEGQPWIYVEVTRPNPAFAEAALRDTMSQLAGLVQTTAGTYAAEVFFLRLPEPGEIGDLRELFEKAFDQADTTEIVLPDELGVVYLSASPSFAVVEDHGYPPVPRLGQASVAVERGQAVRQIVIRAPYYDLRGHQFLAAEAAQLPDDAPGLIVIDMAGAPSGMKEWIPVLEGELELGLYDQVSAICLFHGGIYGTERGESWQAMTGMILNETATHRLPEWLEAPTQLSA